MASAGGALSRPHAAPRTKAIMAPWKVLLTGLLAGLSFCLVIATLLAPIVVSGNERWAWMGGLFVGAAFAVALFVGFLRYASASMDVKPRRAE